MEKKHAKKEKALAGVIAGFPTMRRHQDSRAPIVRVDGVTDRAAAVKLVGRTVWYKRADGLTIRGEVHAPHGNGGLILARFRRQLPPAEFPLKVELH